MSVDDAARDRADELREKGIRPGALAKALGEEFFYLEPDECKFLAGLFHRDRSFHSFDIQSFGNALSKYKSGTIVRDEELTWFERDRRERGCEPAGEPLWSPKPTPRKKRR